MTEPKTYALEVPGAVLHYDVRAGDDSTQPVLLIIGSPMGASGFGTLAERFADRTVVTYDPRGAERSKRTDGALETTPTSSAGEGLGEPEHVARGIAERAVPDAVELVDRLLQHLGPRGADLLERRVAVVGAEDDAAQQALGQQRRRRLAVG